MRLNKTCSTKKQISVCASASKEYFLHWLIILEEIMRRVHIILTVLNTIADFKMLVLYILL